MEIDGLLRCDLNLKILMTNLLLVKSLTMVTSNKNKNFILNLFINFKETTDGRKIKCLFNLHGDKLVCEQRDRKTKNLQVVAVRSVDENGKMVEVRSIFLFKVLV